MKNKLANIILEPFCQPFVLLGRTIKEKVSKVWNKVKTEVKKEFKMTMTQPKSKDFWSEFAITCFMILFFTVFLACGLGSIIPIIIAVVGILTLYVMAYHFRKKLKRKG